MLGISMGMPIGATHVTIGRRSRHPLLPGHGAGRGFGILASKPTAYTLHFVFQQHVVLGSKTHAGPENVFNAASLPEEGIDHGGARGHQWSLAEETEDGEDRMEVLEVGVAVSAERDALAQLSEDHQVQDDGAGQKRVLRAQGAGTTGHMKEAQPGLGMEGPHLPLLPQDRPTRTLYLTCVMQDDGVGAPKHNL